MSTTGRVLLRILLSTFQKQHHRPVYELIVEKAHRHGLAGVTVLEGIEGFMNNGVLLKESPLHAANNRIALIEIVDSLPAIDSFLEQVDELLQQALVTKEDILIHSHPTGGRGL